MALNMNKCNGKSCNGYGAQVKNTTLSIIQYYKKDVKPVNWSQHVTLTNHSLNPHLT